MIQVLVVMRDKNNSAARVAGSCQEAPKCMKIEDTEYSFHGLIFYRLSYKDIFSKKLSLINFIGQKCLSPKFASLGRNKMERQLEIRWAWLTD